MADIERGGTNLEEDDSVAPIAVELARLLTRLPVALRQSGLWAEVCAELSALREAGVIARPPDGLGSA